ncbi:MAG: TolC family protein [bacterium]
MKILDRTPLTTTRIRWTWRSVIVAFWLLVVTGGASAETETSMTAALGFVDNDTLYVTAEQVTRAALQYNEALAAASAYADAARAEALAAWQGFLPQVHLSAMRIRSDDPLASFGFKLNQRQVTTADFDPTLLNDPGTAENNIMQLKLLQPIFNGGMGINGKRAANAASRAAAFELARSREQIEFQAAQTYHGLVLAKSLERVMLDGIAAARGHLRQAQALVDAEMATEADLLQAKVHLSGLEQQLIVVQNGVAMAGEYIKLLTALDSHLPLAPAPEARAAELEPLPAASSLDGIDNRADLLAREQQVVAAARMVGVANGTLLPHLNLSLERYYYSRNDLFGRDAESWTVGIYGTWNLFGGLGNIGEMKRARAARRAIAHQFDFEVRQAKLQARQAWLDARAAGQRVAVAHEAVAAARESQRIVSSQYREGLASMVDLLDIQASVTRTEGDLVQALYDYQIGQANLRYSGAVSDPKEDK